MDLLSPNPESSLKPPLADLVRPSSIDQMMGQEHLLSPDAPFRKALESGVLGSFILWGPPGSGKTTLAILVARQEEQHFVRFSAVTGGVKQVRQIVSEAEKLRRAGTATMLFVDEIHRFNKAQQDAFLPHVENGTIRLAGATTENPSFEINAPLLSRCTVYVLHPLDEEAITSILSRAVGHPGFEGRAPGGFQDGVLQLLASAADGDSRRALNMLEQLAGSAADSTVTMDMAKRVVGASPLRYDKSGEEHYNLISALHKSLRSGDVDAALYWLARMIESGENPLYIGRRLVRFASEDVGLADPSALTVAMRAVDSYRFLGSPEGDLALAEAVCYLALAPRSNSVYKAWKKALKEARDHGSLPVPLHLRNAPTDLMKRFGYAEGYQYAHEVPGGVVSHTHFPSRMGEPTLYQPGNQGREKALAEKLAKWKRMREEARKKREGSEPTEERPDRRDG